MNTETKAPEEKWPFAKTSFFVALGFGFAAWVLLLINLIRVKDPDAAQRRWTTLLVVLGIVDVIVLGALVFIGMNANAIGTLRAKPPRSAIGVVVAPKPVAEGLKISAVSPGSPADQAHLVAGDVIDLCDGQPVRSSEELRACVGKHLPGTGVNLSVIHEGARTEREFFTKGLEDLAPLPETGTKKEPVCRPLEPPDANQLIAFGAFVALGLFVLIRRGGFSVLALSLGVVVISFGGHFIASLFCDSPIPDAVRSLIELPFSPLSLLLVAVLVDRFALQSSAPKVLSGRPGWFEDAVLAIWVHLTGMVRLAFILGAVLIAIKTSPIEATPVEELITEGAKTPLMKLLFFITAAVLAPICEERFFRGAMMEGLMRVMRPWVAVACVAIVFGLLHGGYGIRAVVVIWLACVLGWARLQSQGLKASIVLHAAQNTVVALIFLLRG